MTYLTIPKILWLLMEFTVQMGYKRMGSCNASLFAIKKKERNVETQEIYVCLNMLSVIGM